jgi:hypothetical protein
MRNKQSMSDMSMEYDLNSTNTVAEKQKYKNAAKLTEPHTKKKPEKMCS